MGMRPVHPLGIIEVGDNNDLGTDGFRRRPKLIDLLVPGGFKGVEICRHHAGTAVTEQDQLALEPIPEDTIQKLDVPLGERHRFENRMECLHAEALHPLIRVEIHRRKRHGGILIETMVFLECPFDEFENGDEHCRLRPVVVGDSTVDGVNVGNAEPLVVLSDQRDVIEMNRSIVRHAGCFMTHRCTPLSIFD